MTGQPASLPDVQAAILKSAAGQAGQGSASLATSTITQDLSVMADQAKGYTEVVNQGVANADTMAASVAKRMEQDKALAEEQRSLQVEIERIQMEAAAAARARAAAESGAADARRRQKEMEDAMELQVEMQEQNAALYLHKASRKMPTRFRTIVDDLLLSSIDYEDAQEAIDSAIKYGDIRGDVGMGGANAYSKDVRKRFLTVAREYHDRLQGRK